MKGSLEVQYVFHFLYLSLEMIASRYWVRLLRVMWIRQLCLRASTEGRRSPSRTSNVTLPLKISSKRHRSWREHVSCPLNRLHDDKISHVMLDVCNVVNRIIFILFNITTTKSSLLTIHRVCCITESLVWKSCSVLKPRSACCLLSQQSFKAACILITHIKSR